METGDIKEFQDSINSNALEKHPFFAYRIARLSPLKRDLLNTQLQQQTIKLTETKVDRPREMVPVSRNQPLFLSWRQQQLWSLEQSDNPVPVQPHLHAFQLDGCLDVVALQRSFQTIIDRHEMLRTAFLKQDDSPVQVIAAQVTLDIPVVDVQGLSEADQREKVRYIINGAANQRFNLAQPPLLRVRLIRLQATSHILLLAAHPIVLDARSIQILSQEISLLYQLYSQNQSNLLPALPIQYADFAQWQRQQENQLNQQIRYWQQQLSHPPGLNLPSDRPRSTQASWRADSQCFVLDSALTQDLKTLGRKAQATLFVTLLTALTILLARNSAQNDLIIATSVANRTPKETESLMGPFANILALRIQLGDRSTTVDLIKQIHRILIEAYRHQDLPFEQVVRAVQPEFPIGSPFLAQALFVFQSQADTDWNLPGLNVSPLEIPQQTTQFAVTLSIQVSKDQLLGTWTYQTDLFNAEQIERMTGHFQALLASMVVDSQQLITQLPMTTEAERQHIIAANTAKLDYSRDQCIHEQFEQQVRQNPDAIAVVYEDQRLTYNQLNQAANQLAHYLKNQGVKSEMLVGICVERSLDTIIGLLGILKAGAAYVALDPTYPIDQLNYVLQDTQTPILLTQSKLSLELSTQDIQLIWLDEDADLIAQQSSENPIKEISSDSLAYIVYTSGSTGKPKGVMVNHSSVARLFPSARTYVHFDEKDTWTLFHSYAFGFSVWEIFGALLHGGRLVIVPKSTTVSPQEFYSLVCREHVTVLSQTPTAFRLFLQAQELVQTKPHSLRLIVFSGESLEPYLLKTWIAQNGDESPLLVNMYALSETAGEVAFRRLTQKDLDSPNRSVIGVPLPDVSIYLLDANLQPVLPGEIGEMYIGGPAVARGYLNLPKLTAEKFIVNPFQSFNSINSDYVSSNNRLYKTGDLARYLPNGELEFVGRCDRQIKIRGFRIELDGIEAVLAQHSGVKEAVVIAREDQPAEQYLAAYVVPQQNDLDSEMLRQFLQQQLPSYMTPAVFVMLESLPLTPSGKIDRHALPAPNLQATRATFVAPRNEIEFRLRKIWMKVLANRSLSIHDNFFELGGNSLLAISVLARIEAKFGQTLPLSALLEAPTIEALARRLTVPDCISASRSLVPLKPTGSKRPLFYVHPRSGNVILYGNLARYLDPERPFYGLQAIGLNGEQKPLNCLEEMAAYYIQEIQTVQPEGPYLLGGRCLGGIVALEMAQQLLAQGQQVLLLVLVEAPLSGRVDPNITRKVRQNMKKAHELDHRYANRFQQIMDANDQARRNYQVQVYPGRVAYFRAEQTSHDPSTGFGWADLAVGGFDVYRVAGNHDSIDEEPNVRILANQISTCLDWAELQPGTLNLHTRLGRIHSRQGTFNKALENYQKVVELEPHNPWAYKDLGDLLVKIGQYEDAVTAYQQLIQLQPEHSVHFRWLVNALLMHGDIEQAITIGHQGLRLRPDDPDLCCQLSAAYHRQGNLTEAIAYAQQAIQIDPESVVAYTQLGEMLMQQDQVTEAIALYQTAIEAIPNQANLFWGLGSAQERQGNFDAALTNYQKASSLNPSSTIYQQIGGILSRKGQLEQAIAAYQSAIQLQPDADGYKCLGNVQEQHGAGEAAMTSYQKAIELCPQQPAEVYKKLGDLSFQIGAMETAISAYREAFKLQLQEQVRF